MFYVIDIYVDILIIKLSSWILQFLCLIFMKKIVLNGVFCSSLSQFELLDNRV